MLKICQNSKSFFMLFCITLGRTQFILGGNVKNADARLIEFSQGNESRVILIHDDSQGAHKSLSFSLVFKKLFSEMPFLPSATPVLPPGKICGSPCVIQYSIFIHNIFDELITLDLPMDQVNRLSVSPLYALRKTLLARCIFEFSCIVIIQSLSFHL